MSMAIRSKRIQRSRRRNGKGAGLNLTALMDIFTILLFFLMVNQSDVTVQGSDSIELPVSLADKQPEEQLTVLITKEDILVQGRAVARIAEVLAAEEEDIAGLRNELNYLAQRTPLTAEEAQQGRAITILGDKDTAYALLKKVMKTCAQAEFNHISLAVEQNFEQGGGHNG